MANHVAEITIVINAYTFVLEIDIEDKDNLIIESVTAIDGPMKSDTDMDPDDFEEEWMTDEIWDHVREKLGAMK